MGLRSKVALVEGVDPSTSVKEAVDLLGGLERHVNPRAVVVIKPNLCLPSPPSQGLTTDPEVVGAIIRLCREAGASRIIVGDTPIAGYSGREVMKVTGMEEVAEETGAETLDFHEDAWVKIEIPDGIGVKRIRLPRTVLTCDTLINVPKMKSHGMCMVTLALKNFQGLVHSVDKILSTHGAPGFEREPRVGGPPYPRQGLEYALVDLHSVVKADIHIVDGIIGPQKDWGGYAGLKPGLLVAGTDPVAVDVVATRAMGLDPENVNMIQIASEKDIGAGDVEGIEVIGSSLYQINAGYKIPESFSITDAEDNKEKNLHIISGRACNICLSVVKQPLKRISDTTGGRLQPTDFEELTLVVGKDATIPSDYRGKLVLYGNCAVEQWEDVHPFEDALKCPGCAPAGGSLWLQWKQGRIRAVK